MPFVSIVNDSDLTVLPTAMQAVHTDFKKGLGRVNRRAIDLVSAKAEQNFAASIVRDATSATAGAEPYRPGSRMTGRFTFGKGKTFTGSLLRNLGPNVAGFGYPVVDRADKITQRVWRGLEYGWDTMRMPLGVWRDAEGNRVRSTEGFKIFGGDQFYPTGPASREVSGIDAKQFITTAFEWIVENYVQREYQRVAEEAAAKGSRRSR